MKSAEHVVYLHKPPRELINNAFDLSANLNTMLISNIYLDKPVHSIKSALILKNEGSLLFDARGIKIRTIVHLVHQNFDGDVIIIN